MATSWIPVQFNKDGQDPEFASTPAEFYQYLWDGWVPGAPLPGPARDQIAAHLSDLDELAATMSGSVLEVNAIRDELQGLVNDPVVIDGNTATALATPGGASDTYLRSVYATLAAMAGKADLIGGKIPSSQLPPISTNDVITVADAAARLALTVADVSTGDIVIQSDTGKRYLLGGVDPSLTGSWILLDDASGVTSVNGQVGTVTLGKADIGLNLVDNTSDLDKELSLAAIAALAAKADLNKTIPVIRATQFNDGASDATAYINGLITAANALSSGARIVLDGSYLFDAGTPVLTGGVLKYPAASTRGVLAKANVTVECTPGTKIIRGYSSTSAMGGSLVKGYDQTVKVNKFRWIGGEFTVSGPSVPVSGAVPGTVGTPDGNVFGWYGDDWVLSGPVVSSWMSGRAIQMVGDRWRIYDFRATGSDLTAGSGGIRVLGGKDGIAFGCHVESGDDCYQVVPSGSSGASPQMFNVDCERIQFIGCTGFSVKGRFVLVGMQNRDGNPGNGLPPTAEMTTNVRDCRWIACVGKGGSANSWHFTNDNSTGELSGIRVLGCQNDTGDAQGSPVEVDITRGSSQFVTMGGQVGRVRDIIIDGWTMRKPRRMVLRTAGGVENLTLRGFVFEAPVFKQITGLYFTTGSNVYSTTTPQFTQAMVGAPLVPPNVTTGIPSAAVYIGSVAPDGMSCTVIKSIDLSGATATKTVLPANAINTVYVGGKNTLDLSGTRRALLENCRVEGSGGGDVVVVGTAADQTLPSGQVLDNKVYDIDFTRCEFTGIPDGYYGVNLGRVDGAYFGRNQFRSAAGATIPGGVLVSATAANVVVGPGNRFSDLLDPTRRVVIQPGGQAVITFGSTGVTPDFPLADGSITTPKIGDAQVTGPKLADGSVTAVKIQDGAVGTSELADGSVTSAKMGNDAVTTPSILDGAVTAPKLGDITELVQDIVGNMLVSGGSLTLAYDDAGTGQITITASGGDTEAIRDAVGVAMVGVNGITLAIDDPGDTITIGISGLTTSQVTGLDAALAALVPATRDIQTGTGLLGGGNLTASRTLSVDFGTAAGKVVEGNDPRLNPPQIDVFTASGTWTKPSWAKTVHVFLLGAGGGGGAGGVIASGAAISGGAGGSGAGLTQRTLVAAALGATETVTVGAGGAGGAGILGSSGAATGPSGSIGGDTSFGSWVRARGGNPGPGGSTTTPAAPAGGNGSTAGGPGGASGTGAVGGTPNPGNGPGGGGGGGGISTVPAAKAGGDGTAAQMNPLSVGGTGGAVGAAGGTGTGSTATASGGSTGPGGGGGGSTITAAANGGNGGSPQGFGGGGGGGGSILTTGGTSGSGGTGAPGVAIIISMP